MRVPSLILSTALLLGGALQVSTLHRRGISHDSFQARIKLTGSSALSSPVRSQLPGNMQLPLHFCCSPCLCSCRFGISFWSALCSSKGEVEIGCKGDFREPLRLDKMTVHYERHSALQTMLRGPQQGRRGVCALFFRVLIP